MISGRPEAVGGGCSDGIRATSPDRDGGPATSPNSPASESTTAGRRFALVVWQGEIGGAETLMLALAQRFRVLNAEAELVIIGPGGPLVERLRAVGLTYTTLGFHRGRAVLRHPRRLAQVARDRGPSGALLMECGYLGACLRVGGYRGPIVAVEHGPILFPSRTRRGRLWDRFNRASGAWAADAEVGVSQLVLDRMRQQPHPRRLHRIYNGIDTAVFTPDEPRETQAPDSGLTAGFVGRLAAEKGLHILVRAVAQACADVPVRLLIAGDGPEREELVVLARELGIAGQVCCMGWVHDIHAFWRRCDVAIVPSHFTESFCLAAVEAAACGKPVIATRTGALTEVVRDGITGMLIQTGDVQALTKALLAYARNPGLRREHGAAGRDWASESFNIDQCARSYLELFAEVDASRR